MKPMPKKWAYFAQKAETSTAEDLCKVLLNMDNRGLEGTPRQLFHSYLHKIC
jgi:hypothetical protein